MTATNTRTRSAERGLGVLGVPTSAGSHNPGQEKAPAAWRAAGLLKELSGHGLAVEDFGDLPVQRHRPSPPVDGVRDLERVAETARRTAAEVAAVVATGRLPLVLGGDCTITLGAVAGLSARGTTPGLVYFDGDADLSTPETTDSAVLDTMGTTHLLGDGAPALARLGGRHPLLPADHIALLGFDPAELSTEHWGRLAAHRLHATPVAAVRADPAGAAVAALAHVEARAESVLVHFDVDVLDTGAFPLANFPHFNGLTLDQAESVLARLCASPAFAGLVVTEVNPDHDPEGELLRRLAEVLGRVLAGAVPPGVSGRPAGGPSGSSVAG
ncbi:arginase family protein [Streptacidiphilus sp. N1-10]|uniref:Arginase family protein n=1 Tax=Streptacidiphilus jeojiensis TaxID=3229225 RepID=A0ABV6XQB3_9ACTN